MTLCCFDVPSQYSPVDTATPYNGFPGNRRNHGFQQPPQMYMPTGGNALQAYDPSASYQNSGVINNGATSTQMIQVTVPEGVHPGQVLHVTVPDGSGRVVAATVPPGLHPGATFMVAAPNAHPNNNLPVATPIPDQQQSQQPQQIPTVTATPYYPNQPTPTVPTYYPNQNYAANPNQEPPSYNNYGQPYSNNSYYNPQQQRVGNNGMAPVIAGVAGAAMLAGAGALAYEAMAHRHQDNNEYVDNVYDGNDDIGDFGGGDY